MNTPSMELQPPVMEKALNALRYRWPDFRPAAGLILGSGWSEVIEAFTVRDAMAYTDIPGLGSTGVPGHAGRLLRAELHGIPTAIFQGRRHWYEGEGWTPVALPVFLLSKLDARTVLLTNAAGGITEGLKAGDLMMIRDHIHFIGSHPLTGPSRPDWGPRFPDQSAIYHPSCREHLRRAAATAGVPLKEGVYLAASGPTYETPAEVAMFARLGEQTGQLPLMLQRAATQLSTEVQRRAMHLATILEPLLIVVMGLVVMLIVLAVLMPIIQLNQFVK